MAFEEVAKGGRNMSSMTTPITVLGEPNEVDVKKAMVFL